MKQMDDVEAVAKAVYENRNGAGCVPWSRRELGHKHPYFADARAATETLKSRGWTPPSEGKM